MKREYPIICSWTSASSIWHLTRNKKRWLGLNLLLAIAQVTLTHRLAYDLFWIHGHCQTWTWSRNRWRHWQESQPSIRRRNTCNEPWPDMTLCPHYPCEFRTFNDIHPKKHPFWNTHTIRQNKLWTEKVFPNHFNNIYTHPNDNPERASWFHM